MLNLKISPSAVAHEVNLLKIIKVRGGNAFTARLKNKKGPG
jgi:hypothetical protein